MRSLRLTIVLIISGLFHTSCDEEGITANARLDKCESNCPQINLIRPTTAKPGDQITIEGTGFQEDMIILLGTSDSAEVKMISDTQVTAVLPAIRKKGKLNVGLLAEGLFSEGPSLYIMDDDYPTFSSTPDLICKGEKFYDRTGTLTEGTRICNEFIVDPNMMVEGYQIGNIVGSLPYCDNDGQINCITTSTYPAVAISEIPNKVLDVLPPLNRYATLMGDSYGTSAAAIHDRIGDRLATPPRPIP